MVLKDTGALVDLKSTGLGWEEMKPGARIPIHLMSQWSMMIFTLTEHWGIKTLPPFLKWLQLPIKTRMFSRHLQWWRFSTWISSGLWKTSFIECPSQRSAQIQKISKKDKSSQFCYWQWFWRLVPVKTRAQQDDVIRRAAVKPQRSRKEHWCNNSSTSVTHDNFCSQIFFTFFC